MLLVLLSASALVLFLPITTVCFTPSPTFYAAGKLVNSTVWIFGGAFSTGDDSTSLVQKTLWSLDVSQPFSLSSPPWTDHSSDGTNQAFVYARDHTTMEIGSDGSTLWVYGGRSPLEDVSKYNQIITYNINSKSWSTPPIQGNPIIVRSLAVARGGNGILYYFGGATTSFSGSPVTIFTRIDSVQSLNTVTGEYKILSVAPSNLPGRYGHSMTTVGTNIYMIGGGIATSATSSTSLPINVINVFDTTNNVWTSHTSTGNVTPSNRFYHTAVLTPDSQRIVIFGGRIIAGPQMNDVWILDLTSLVWTLATTTGTPPVNLANANVALVGNQMLVMFGSTVGNDSISSPQNSIHVLDMSANPWAWVDTFTPPVVSSSSTTADSTAATSASASIGQISTEPTPSNKSIGLSVPAMVGLIIGVSAFLVGSVLVGWFYFARRNSNNRRKQESPDDAPSPSQPRKPPVLESETYQTPNEIAFMVPNEVDSSEAAWRTPGAKNGL